MKSHHNTRNFLWLDLEMTGLDIHHDVIVEIAAVITDSNLHVIAQGPSLVIGHPEAALARMHDDVKHMHTKSGLLDEVKKSTLSLKEAEAQTINFLKQHAGKEGLLLAGNTVWQDRIFLAKYMPRIFDYLHYRIIDVSSIKELIRHWYPNHPHAIFEKPECHRALADVFASIEELNYYRKHFFIASQDLG